MLSNKRLNLVVTTLFMRSRKLNISLVFITKSYFAVPKNIRINLIHHFIMKFQRSNNLNKLHFIIHQILTLKTMYIYKKGTAKPCFFSYSCYSCMR